jgi:hypothetical protein
MERKYKQRGYMDDQSDSGKKDKPQQRPKPSGIKHFGMRNGGTARSGSRCALCGKTLPETLGGIEAESTCPSCGADLHTCTNCAFFNTSSRWECSKPIPERIAPKDARNNCTFFSPRVFVERTFESAAGNGNNGNSTTPTNPQDARRAFDALFKK